MYIAIHARKLSDKDLVLLFRLVDLVKSYQKIPLFSLALSGYLQEKGYRGGAIAASPIDRLAYPNVELLISLGGDGILLDAVHEIRDFSIPLMGISTGTLGFLTKVDADQLVDVLSAFFGGNYTIECHVLLALQVEGQQLDIALNEVAFLKAEQVGLLAIDGYIHEQLITRYWVDGLVIATPTGSTAYSMSGFGPIMTPGARSLVITPLNPHSLAMRPLIVPDDAELYFEVKSRRPNFLISVDGRSHWVEYGKKIKLQKWQGTVKMVQFNHTTFFDVLREKFYWGQDGRKRCSLDEPLK